MLGAVLNTLGPHCPSLTELMLSDVKGKRSQHPWPGTPWPSVPAPHPGFGSRSTRTRRQEERRGSDPGLSRQNEGRERYLRSSWAVSTGCRAVIKQRWFQRGFLCCSGKNWDGGRSEKIPPEGDVFSLLTPKVTGNLQITHPFPGTLAGKKSRGLTIFLQTHTHALAHTKEPCKDLNTSCACPCQNFLNPPPFTLACQAMQIFERPPRFRSVWCKNPHRIQAVKAVTHSYSAARSPVRQAKLSYSRRSLEHTLAHLSHRSKECNHFETSPACLPFLKSDAKKLLPSRQRTGWHRYSISGKENEVLSQQLLKVPAQMSSAA